MVEYMFLLFVVGVIVFVLVNNILSISREAAKLITNNKIYITLLSFVPLGFMICGFLMDKVNSLIVYVHFAAFWYVLGFIRIVIRIIWKKDLNRFYFLLIAMLITSFVMIRAYKLAHNVVVTNYTVSSSKLNNNYKIVQISDSHLGTTFYANKFSEYIDDINKLNPDLVVITGDFIDDNTSQSDLEDGAKALSKLNTKYGVYFIYGNHDKGYINNRDTELRKLLEDNNVIILEDNSVEISDDIVLIGRQDAQNKKRKDARDLTVDVDKDKYLIMLDHQPNDYKNEEKAHVDLVLSGHTHGGQLIPIGQFGKMFGTLDSVYGINKRCKTTFIVSSGISDWAMKFKTGTISEYVVIDLNKE